MTRTKYFWRNMRSVRRDEINVLSAASTDFTDFRIPITKRSRVTIFLSASVPLSYSSPSPLPNIQFKQTSYRTWEQKEEEWGISYERENLPCVLAFCPLPCRERRRLFLWRKVLWPDGEEIVRARRRNWSWSAASGSNKDLGRKREEEGQGEKHYRYYYF